MSDRNSSLPAPLAALVQPLTDTWLLRPVSLTLRWCWLFYRELRKDTAFLRAAGMAYATLIALVPMLVLVFGTLGAFGARSGNATDVAHALVDQILGELPMVQDTLLPGLLEVDLGALGAVAVFGLLLTAGRLYLAVERAYSAIFAVPVRRRWMERILTFYFTVTAIPVAAVVTITATWELAADWGYGDVLGPLAMTLTYLLLLGALKFFPSTEVRWIPACTGAAVSFILLELGRKGFGLYVDWIVTDDPLRVIYGSLGLIPVFLLWMYLFWVFVLLGVEIAFVLQHYDNLVEAEQAAASDSLDHFPQLDDALAVAGALATTFASGDGPQPFDAMSRHTGLELAVLSPVLRILESAGFVVETPRGYLLTHPPESLALTDLASAWTRAIRYPSAPAAAVHEEVSASLHLDGSLAEGAQRWSNVAD